MFYKQIVDQLENKVAGAIKYDVSSVTSFVFDPANTDYQTFKREVAAGTPLEDPDGNIMSQEQVNAFLATIP